MMTFSFATLGRLVLTTKMTHNFVERFEINVIINCKFPHFYPYFLVGLHDFSNNCYVHYMLIYYTASVCLSSIEGNVLLIKQFTR